MNFYSWVPRGREIEERCLVGIFFLALCGVIAFIVEVVKWLISLL